MKNNKSCSSVQLLFRKQLFEYVNIQFFYRFLDIKINRVILSIVFIIIKNIWSEKKICEDKKNKIQQYRIQYQHNFFFFV